MFTNTPYTQNNLVWLLENNHMINYWSTLQGGCNRTNIQIIFVDSSLDHRLCMQCMVSGSICLLHQFLVESSSPRVYKDKLHWNMMMTQQSHHKGLRNKIIIQIVVIAWVLKTERKAEQVMMLTMMTKNQYFGWYILLRGNLTTRKNKNQYI